MLTLGDLLSGPLGVVQVGQPVVVSLLRFVGAAAVVKVGLGFIKEDAEAMVNKYIRQINTGSFAAYANRIAAANLRRIS